MRKLILTIPDTEGSIYHGEFSFFVKDDIQQLQYTFATPKSLWIHLFFEREGVLMGQLLITHKKENCDIVFGTLPNLTSETAEVAESLKGNWVIKYFVNEGYSGMDFSVTITEKYQEIIQFEERTELTTQDFGDTQSNYQWFKGDFHTHTRFSDGSMSPQENLISAQEQQLDFFFATDHNILANKWPLSDDVVVFPGTELTTNFGHGNFLGLHQPILTPLTMPLLGEKYSITEIIEKNQHNGLFSINHPFLDPWSWKINLPLYLVQALELINDPTFGDNLQANQKAFQVWSKLWNQGWLLTGLGGSDSHLLPHERYEGAKDPSLIGDPVTFVYTHSLKQAALLQAVQSGHTQVSRIGKLKLTDNEDLEVIPGSKLLKQKNIFTLTILEPDNLPEEFRIEWIFDGISIAEDTETESTLELGNVLEGYHWLRGDIRDDATGEYLASFTPVYWGEPVVIGKTWNEVVLDGTN